MQRQADQKSLQYIEILILAFSWLVIFLSPLIFQNELEHINWNQVLGNWRKLLPFVLLSLFNHFLLVPLLFFRKYKKWYFAGAVATLVLFVFILNWIPKQTPQAGEHPFPREFQHRPPPRERPLPPIHEREARDMPQGRQQPPPMQTPGALPPYLNSLLIAIMILGFDTGLRTVFRWTKSEQEREILTKEKVKSELAFLRNQISPHFFMNTLNNIHALIDFDKEEAKESVIKLSGLMRYLLYESEGEKILLKKEIEFLKNYIELMKLRFTDQVEVRLDLPDSLPDKQIPPLLFTSFLENAFKHGVSYDNPSFIHIAISNAPGKLFLRIHNSKHKTPKKDTASGIGMENTKKRLDLIFKGDYTLDITDKRDTFEINLSIPV